MSGLKASFAALALVGSMSGAAMAETASSPACEAREAVFYFATGEATLDAFGEASLERFAEDAKACAVAKIKVVGHADAVGSNAANKQLSRARAEATFDALTNAGLEPVRVELEAAGEADADRPMARRAVVRLVMAAADADLG